VQNSFGTSFRLRSLRNAYRAFVPAAVAGLALANSALAVQTGSVTTTIYVGPHFEVRDHDQPTKYVFNGATRVAEITGSLSANPRVQRLRLYSGWNLCSLAVTGPFPASGAEAISAVYAWNQPTRDYSAVNLGQNLAAGTVLWVRVKTNATITVLGSYSDPTAEQVPAGGAYIPASGLEAWALELPPTFSAWLYDPTGAQWDEQLPGGLASMSDLPSVLSPGEAFYAESDAPVPLAPTDPTLRIRYYHQDHLGSSSVVTDNAGGLVEESAFHPFGIPRNKYRPRQVDQHYEFTQKERDPESGLNYFEAGYLTAGLSRFATVDSKYAEPCELSPEELGSFLSDPQKMNLYGYVQNSPLTHVDPTGFGYCDMEPYDYSCQEARDFEDPPSVGQQVQVLGGMLEAASGAALCETVIGCALGGPMMAHGADNIQAGVRGTTTLTADYLGAKVDLAMNILPLAVSGVNLIRGLASGGTTLARAGAAEAGTIRGGAARTFGGEVKGGGGVLAPTANPEALAATAPAPNGAPVPKGAPTAATSASAPAAAATQLGEHTTAYLQILKEQSAALRPFVESGQLQPSYAFLVASKQADAIFIARFGRLPPGYVPDF
jgi:RHS repeat-associated protein